jgi:magnesium transporter
MNWTIYESPTFPLIKTLSNSFDVDVINDVLDVDELSRVDSDDDYYYVIVRVPIKKTETEYRPVPLGIFVKEDHVTLVCGEKLQFLERFRFSIKTDSFSKPSEFILAVLKVVNVEFTKHLKSIDSKSTLIRLKLQRSVDNEYLLELFDLEKSLVLFTNSLKSNQILLRRLNKFGRLKLSSEDEEALEDAIVDNEQTVSMADTNSNVLSGMMDAYASCISNNLNVVMKRLTVISIVMMVSTLVASVFGMNVGFPEWLTHSPVGMAVIFGGGALVTVTSYVFFARKKLTFTS